jgi:type I restriction enzyme, S subunit
MLKHQIPKPWRITTLELHADVRTGIAKGKKGLKSPVSLPYLRVANVQDGYLNLSEIKTIDVEKKDADRYRLQEGDVLLTEGGDFDKLGRGAVWRGEIPHCLHQNHIFSVRPHLNELIPEFLSYQAGSVYGKRYFQSCSKQSTNLASINTTQLRQFPLLLPPLAEQRAIVEVLRKWDAAIDTTDRLIAAKQSKRDYHYRNLVSWSRHETVPIGSVIEAVARPVPTPKEAYNALGIRSHGKGTFQRTIERPEEIDMETVYVVGPHDLIVNITFAWEGAIALAKAEDAGCFVSHRFPTFEVKEDRVNRDFLGYAVRSRRFFHDLGIASPGGAGRNRVLNKTAFLKLEIPFPPKEEQDRIARYLLDLDKEITILKTYLTAIKKQRRGLMQKLLTGEWRVPVRDGDIYATAARVTEEAAQ